jgi:hypothetical protein
VAVGDIAGSVMNTGYIEISVEGARWLGHRLAFLFMLGEVPRNVDHINRIKSDNRWENLRACTHKENMQNVNVRRTSLTGIRNVHKHKRSGLYFVSLRLNGKVTSFGYYKDIELAELVAIEARNKYFNIKE